MAACINQACFFGMSENDILKANLDGLVIQFQKWNTMHMVIWSQIELVARINIVLSLANAEMRDDMP